MSFFYFRHNFYFRLEFTVVFVIIIYCSLFSGRVASEDLLINCSLNANIYRPSSALILDIRHLSPYPCSKIILQNIHVREIRTDTSNLGDGDSSTPVVKSFTMQNVTVEQNVQLQLSFFDWGGLPDTLTQLVLQNVRVKGIRPPAAVNSKQQSLEITQVLVVSEEDLHSVPRTWTSENSLLPGAADVAVPPDWYFREKKEFLAKNALRSVVMEDCLIEDTVTSDQQLRSSKYSVVHEVYFSNLVIRGEVVVRRNNISTMTGGIRFKPSTFADGTVLRIYENNFQQNDLRIVNFPLNDSGICNLIALEVINESPRSRALSVGISSIFDASITSTRDLTTSIQVFSNNFTSVIKWAMDVASFRVGHCALGQGTNSERLSLVSTSTTPAATPSSLPLPSPGIAFFNNTVFADHTRVAEYFFAETNVRSHQHILFDASSNISVIGIYNNKINITRQGVVAAIAFTGVHHVEPGGVDIHGNDIFILNEGNSSVNVRGIDFRSGTERYSQILIRNNKFNLRQIVSNVHLETKMDLIFSANVGTKFWTLIDVDRLEIGNNEFTQYLLASAERLAVISTFGFFEQAWLQNVGLIFIHDNDVRLSGTVQSTVGCAFENDIFVNVRSIVMIRNHFDLTQLIPTDTVGAQLLLWFVPQQAKSYLRRVAVGGITLFLSDNAGADSIAVENNSMVFQLPAQDISFLFSSINIFGSFTDSRGARYTATRADFGAQTIEMSLPRFNSKMKVRFVGNNFTAIPNNFFLLGHLQSTVFAGIPMSLLRFGPVGDAEATIHSVLVANNYLVSEFGGSAEIVLIAGTCNPTNGFIVRNNSVRIKGFGSGASTIAFSFVSAYVDDVANGHLVQWNYEHQRRRSRFVSFYGPRNWFPSPSPSSSSAGLIIEANNFDVQNSFGDACFLCASSCNDTACVAGNIRLRNNTIKFSQNAESQVDNVQAVVVVAPKRVFDRLNLELERNVVFIGSHDESKIVASCGLVQVVSAPPEASSASSSSASSASSGFAVATQNLTVAATVGTFSKCQLVFGFKTTTTARSGDIPSLVSLAGNLIVANANDVQDVVLVRLPIAASVKSTFVNVVNNTVSGTSNTATLLELTAGPQSSLDVTVGFFANKLIFMTTTSSGDGGQQDQLLESLSSRVDSTLSSASTAAEPITSMLVLNVTANPTCNLVTNSSHSQMNAMFHNVKPYLKQFIVGDVCSVDTSPSSAATITKNNSQQQQQRDRSRRTRTLTATVLPKPTTANKGQNLSPVLSKSTSVLGGVSIVAATAAVAVVPSVGFGVSRQQAMVSFVQGIRDGDCSGVSPIDEIPAADSPTQLSIGSSAARLLVGGAVGNVVLSLSFVLVVQLAGHAFLKKVGSSSWKRPYSVFARCHGAMILFICMSLLFAPTIKFGLVVIALPSSSRWNVPVGEKILAGIFSLGICGIGTFFYTVRSLFLRERKEVYKKIRRAEYSRSATQPSFVSRVYSYWFEGRGEWRMPPMSKNKNDDKNKYNSKQHTRQQHQQFPLRQIGTETAANSVGVVGVVITERDLLDFDAATPLLDGFQGHAWFFGAIEFALQFGLALAEFLAQLVPVEKSCVTQASVLIAVFATHIILSVWLRPFQELFNRLVTPLVTSVELAVVCLALYFQDDPPDFVVELAVAAMSMQSVIAVIVLVVSLSPLLKQVLRVYRRITTKPSTASSRNRGSDFATLTTRMNLRKLRGALTQEVGGSHLDSEEMLLVRSKQIAHKKHEHEQKAEIYSKSANNKSTAVDRSAASFSSPHSSREQGRRPQQQTRGPSPRNQHSPSRTDEGSRRQVQSAEPSRREISSRMSSSRLPSSESRPSSSRLVSSTPSSTRARKQPNPSFCL